MNGALDVFFDRFCPFPVFRTSRIPSLSLIALLCIVQLSSFAATRTWTGGGGDDNWTTAANWGGTAPVAGDDLVFAGTTRLTPNNNFAAGTSFSTITFSVGSGAFVIGGNDFVLTGGATALTASITTGTVTLNNAINFTTAAPTATVAGGGTLALGGVLSGSLGLTKAGTGQLNMTGAGANTYTGTTLVNAGVLRLNKTAASVSIPGNLTIAGGQVSFGTTGAINQVADSAAVTLNNASSVFNGTAGINANAAGVTETIASLTVTGGCFNAGGSVWTITGAVSFTGGAGNSVFVGNSGSQLTFGSLSLTDMTAIPGGTVATNNSFALYGNQTTQSSITSGNISLNNSRLNLRRGAAGMLGSRLILTGNITTTGTAACFITEDVAGGTAGQIEIELSNAAGAVTRTVTAGAGGADITVNIPINNGTSTSGSLTKAGAGTLTLSGANSYTGTTTISAGVLQAGVATVVGTSGAVGVNSPVVFANTAGAVLNITGFNTQVGSITGGGASGGNITLGAATLTVGADNTSPAAYGGVIGGTGNLTKIGTGTLTLSGGNTYSGTTTISAGALQAGVATVVGTSGALGVNSPVVFANTAGATLNITGFNTQVGSITGGGATGGNITLGAATLTVGADNTSPAAYGGTISGTGNLTKIGIGTLSLSGGSGYSGTTTISGGTLSVTNAAGTATGASVVTLAASTTLIGTGTISGTVTVNGTVAPGLAGIGTLTLSGNVAFNNGSALTIEINGATADQLAVGGTLNLNASTTLNVTATTTTQGQTFTIVNKGAGAITGTFNGLAEGSTLIASNRPLLLTYLGGDGNDVVCTDDGPEFTAAGTNTSQSINEGAGLVALAATVPGGRPLTYSIFSGTLPSGISLNANGSFAGMADATSAGVYVLVIRATDDRGTFDATTLTINVTDAGLAITGASVNESAGTATITVTRTGGMGAVSVQADTANASALAGSDYSSTSIVLNWVNAETGPKTFTVPILNDTVSEILESFLVVLSNPVNIGITSGTAVVSITDDDPPIAVADSAVAGQNVPRIINVLANDLGLNNAPISVSIVTPPASGTATANANGTITYLSGVVGVDSFVYRLTDSLGQTAQATVSVTITPAPTFTSQPTVAPNPVIVGLPVGGNVLADFGAITWNWGDGTTSTGSSVSKLYAAPGAYTVTVTAVSVDGATTISTQEVFVSFSLADGTGSGATPPGVTGILVGGSGAGSAQGGSGKIVCNYVRRDKTSYQGSIGSLNFPAALTQASLENEIGTLRIGSSANPATFRFSLDKRGRGKATGVQHVEFNVSKKRFKFKVQREDLTELTEALGGPREFEGAGTPVTLMVPVTVQIGNKAFLALTFQVKYSQIKNSGRGKL